MTLFDLRGKRASSVAARSRRRATAPRLSRSAALLLLVAAVPVLPCPAGRAQEAPLSGAHRILEPAAEQTIAASSAPRPSARFGEAAAAASAPEQAIPIRAANERPTWLAFLFLSQIFLLLLLAHTVSRRQRAERDLKQFDTQFRHIIEASPVGICIITDRRFAYVNRSYVDMFGYDAPEEILGRCVEELYAPEEHERMRRYSRDRPLGKPVPTAYEPIGLRKDGSRFETVARVTLFDYRGRPSSLGFVIDQSSEKQVQRRLEESNRLEAIGTLAGGIAHDFNNILTAILGFTDIALSKTDRGEPAAGELHQVKKAGLRAKEVVQQILTFSRKQKTVFQSFGAAAIVEEVLRLIRASLPATIDIRTDLASRAMIHGDTTQIHQLIMNLCANACYAMREQGGLLDIGLHDRLIEAGGPHPAPQPAPGSYVELSIGDSGPGVPDRLKDKIFEPFFTTKEAGEGTGMGLAQVHGIARNHGAHLQVTDNEPCGARFTVLFPAAGVDRSLPRVIDTERHGGSEHILVVDDEEMVLTVLCRTLQHLGYQTTGSLDSREALRLVTEAPDRFDLVLTDLTMPHLTGDRMAAALLELRPGLPIVLCSGFSAALSQPDPLKTGISAYLDKPVSPETLAGTVRRLLDQAA